MWAYTKRHRLLRNGMYDIDGFIRQLLASDKFDELAEKLAEKAANKIKLKDVDQALGERASRVNTTPNIRVQTDEKHEKEYGRNSMEIVKVFAQNPRAQSDEKHEKEFRTSSTEVIKGFIGKIDPQAVMNESMALPENLKLKYKYLKKNLKNHRDPVLTNGSNEDRSKLNKTMGPIGSKHKNETKHVSSNQNGTLNSLSGTQLNQHDVKMETINEKKGLRDYTKSVEQTKVTKMVTVKSLTDDIQNESRQKNDLLETTTNNLHADPNLRTELKEQEASHPGNAIIEEHPSSLDAELDKPEEVTQKIETKESNELLKALGYVKGSEDSVEENKVPSESDKPYLHGGGGVFRTEDSNDKSDRESLERLPEDQKWINPAETVNEDSPKSDDEDPAKPVLRKEGDKTYTYVQNQDYQEYHEEMAKWRKEHPKNPADFM